MKRLIVTILLLAVCMCLGGCTSTRYSELENRISRLEELLGTNKSTPTPFTTHFTYDTPAPTALTSIHDLSAMSTNEVVNTIIYYIDARPKQGDTHDTIRGRMMCPPVEFDTQDRYIVVRWGVSEDAERETIAVDRIHSIRYDCFLEMDGVTVGVNADRIGVAIELTVMDYERAKGVFEGLREYASSVKPADRILNVNQSGERWSMYWYNATFDYSNDVTMERTDTGYDISVHLD